MNLFTLCGFATACCFVGVLLRNIKPELMPAYTALTSCIIMCECVETAAPITSALAEISFSGGFGSWFKLLLKALAAAIGCETCADICRDCGETSVAGKIELACRIYITALSIPLIKQVLELTGGLLK